MNDLQRIEKMVRSYYKRNEIFPTVNEIASQCILSSGRVREVVEKSDILSLSWTGPKPPGVSSMIVELVEVAA